MRAGRQGHRRRGTRRRPTSTWAGCGPGWPRRCGAAVRARWSGRRAAAALAGPGPGAGGHAVAAARVDHRHRGGAVRRGRRHLRDRDAVRGAARAGGRGGGYRLCLRAGHRSGLGAVAEHGGQRPDGAAGPGAGGVRPERGAGAGRVGRVGGRGRAHVRLAGPDDRGLRAGAGRRDAGPVGERGRGRGRGRLGDRGPVRRRPPAGSSPRRSPIRPWSLPYLAFAACCGAVVLYATRIPRGTS